MNMNDYRRAMDRIAPDPELKERIMNQTTKKRIPVRRAVRCLLAAALALACLFTAALAASPQLRTAVLSFFRMEEHEQLPSGEQSGPDISRAEIGNLVKAQYIRLDSRQYRYCGGGLFSEQTWSEDHRTLLDARFWEAQDNELVPVQVDVRTNQVDITYKSFHYQGEFYWFVREGRMCCFSGDSRSYDENAELEFNWYLSDIPGRTDALLLRLSQGRQMDYSEYPFLYHLDTGEVEDFLAGIEIDKPGRAYSYEWSEDMRRALILYNPPPEEPQNWLCDLETGTLTLLEDLPNVDAQFASFIDSNTLVLSTYTVDQEGAWQDVTCWVYDIPSGRASKTLDRLPYYRQWEETPHGVIIYGKNCLYVSETGQVEVIDLITGSRIPIEGFTCQKGDKFTPSPSGNKLLYFARNPSMDGLGISQIGVANLEKGTFFAFDRDGYENLYEGSIGWQDDNTVGISASTFDGETRYLLLYQF